MSPKHWKMALASPVKILNQSPLMLEPSPISTPKPEGLLLNLHNKNEKVRSAKKVISFDSIDDEPKENIQTDNGGGGDVEKDDGGNDKSGRGENNGPEGEDKGEGGELKRAGGEVSTDKEKPPTNGAWLKDKTEVRLWIGEVNRL